MYLSALVAVAWAGCAAPAAEQASSTSDEAALAAGCGELAPNEALLPGQSIMSCGGRAMLVHQTDGNVVLYASGQALWSTETAGQATGALYMQGDGNIVLYSPDSRPLWQSGTSGQPGARLYVQDDCNAVAYLGATPIWASTTTCPLPQKNVDYLAYVERDTPGYHLAEAGGRFGDSAPPLHFDAHAVGSEFLHFYQGNDFLAVYWAVAPNGTLGVIRDWTSSTGTQRCFSNPGSSCAAPSDTAFAPSAFPRSMVLPILSGAGGIDGAISQTNVTPGAKLIVDWQSFQVNRFSNLDSCNQVLDNPAPLRHREWAYVLDRLDVGGSVGVIENALVTEKEEGGVGPGGNHYEKYVFSPVHGLVFESSRYNDACTAHESSATCDGSYTGRWASHSLRNVIVPGELNPGFAAVCYQGGR